MARNTQTHLQQRFYDLSATIAAKEEKLAVYEGRSGAARGVPDSSLTREQQLEIELAELRSVKPDV